MNNRQKAQIIFIIILITIFISIYIYNYHKYDSYNFKIHIWNAGKADCILISNSDKYIMIDTGEVSLSNEILNYFKKNNIEKLDYLIITHFDKDHVGSASSIIDNIEIDNVLQSNYIKESEYYNNYINSLNEKNIEAETILGNKIITLGDLNIVVNGSEIIYDNNESNNSSLIVSINYYNTNYLFMGDSQNSRISDFITENNNTKYDFIKIPYHGNYQKKLDNLLEDTCPNYAVITCSNTEPEINRTVDLLKEFNIKYYLTKNGNITILSDGNNIKIKQ